MWISFTICYMSGDSVRKDVEILRAIAIIFVILFHSLPQASGGFIGVDIFFVISGFVIGRQLIRRANENQRGFFKDFYIARVKRLFPSLFVMITIVFVVSLLLVDPIKGQQRTAATALLSMIGMSNAYIALNSGGYFDTLASLNPLLHTWSLGVEEQTYLFFPLLVFLAFRKGSRNFERRATKAISFLLGISLLLALFPLSQYPAILGFYSPIIRFWQFGIGLVLAVLENSSYKYNRRILQFLGNCGIVILISSLFFIKPTANWPNSFSLFPTLGTAAIIFASSASLPVLMRILSNKITFFVGKLSYSLYLWHWPLISFGKLLFPSISWIGLAAGLLSFLPAFLSFKFIEMPLRYSNWNLRLKASAVVACCLFCAAGFSAWLVGGFPQKAVKIFRDVNVSSTAFEDACFIGSVDAIISIKSSINRQCSVGQGPSESPIYLVGDSTAQQFKQVLTGIYLDQNRKVTSLTAPSCTPFPGLRMSMMNEQESTFSHCDVYALVAKKYLLEVTPGTIFVSTLDEYYWSKEVKLETTNGLKTNSENLKLKYFYLSADSWLKSMYNHGHSVVFIRPLPNFRIKEQVWSPYRCNFIEFWLNECMAEFDRETIENQQMPYLKAISRLSSKYRASIVDIWPEFCTNSFCSPIQGGKAVYLDSKHLTQNGSFAIKRYLEKLNSLSKY
jgi:peptidoglycan/LPS O-acetylase OafA/YrhL